jgi:TorA maturation chaperone TorD
MGTHLEWEYELESRDLAQAQPKDSQLADAVDAKIEPMTPLCSSSEQDAPMQKLLAQPQGEAWTKWTPATWQSSFHMPQK